MGYHILESAQHNYRYNPMEIIVNMSLIHKYVGTIKISTHLKKTQAGRRNQDDQSEQSSRNQIEFIYTLYNNMSLLLS